MRRLALPTALALLAAASPVSATVDFFGSTTLESSTSRPGCAGIAFNPSDTYPLFRGHVVVLTVVGFAVDNAKEVQLSSLPGVSALVAGRTHGAGSSLKIRLQVADDAPLGNGEIRIRYDVEVAGFDRVLARVVDSPHVGSFSVEAAPGVSQPGGAAGSVPAFDLVPGNLYTLVLKGAHLLDVRPKAPFASQGRFTDVSVLSASDSELKVRLKPVLLGSATLDRTHFQFEKLRCVEPPDGSASIRLSIAVPPTPAPRPATPTPTPSRACLEQKARETAQLSADALRCGDTSACVQIRKNEQKAIEDRFQACLAKGGR